VVTDTRGLTNSPTTGAFHVRRLHHERRLNKVRWKAIEDGKPVWAVNYVFRDDQWETDVHVFTSWPVQERIDETIADLDKLVGGIVCCAGS
jgi:hypothetical protein